ncbi:MAG TPA: ABC transporter ATP-binding protein [Arthrobacter sp.]|nr:ABC transporter ATP-binding protein [Arthrobacter sp.]
MTSLLTPFGGGPQGGRAPGGPGSASGRGPSAAKADKRQLAEHPVEIRRVGRLFRPHLGKVALVLFLVAASSFTGLTQPFLVRLIIDEALPDRNLGLLLMCAGGMVAVAALTAALGVGQTLVATRVGQEVMHRLRSDVFGHLQRQSMRFFVRTRGGEIQSRIVNDIGAMQSVVTSTATGIASNVTVVVGAVAAMFTLDWRMAIVSLLVLPPAAVTTRAVARVRHAITGLRQAKLADLHVQIEEGLSISAVRLSKTLHAGPALSRRFEDTSHELIDLEVRSQLAGRWRMATMQVMFAAVPAVLYLSAGVPVTGGGITIGTLVAFVGLQASLFRPLIGLLNVGIDVTSSLALFSRVFEYLDLPVDIADPAEARHPETVQGNIRFEGVSFAYDQETVLDAVDLSIPAGTSLALVGATGSGKSTLAGLVARLYDPAAGRILLDDVDLRDLSLADVASAVGVVTQETYLVHATVRENLRYAKPDANDSELIAAARAAQIHDLIISLPDGYDTVVGSRGYRFSGGEQQRLAIARTLLRNPRVLVLDEATSALDNNTESQVQAALERLAEGRTTIMIAHRLSTVRNADQIAVLARGRVAELGTHDELLRKDGLYAGLVRRAAVRR